MAWTGGSPLTSSSTALFLRPTTRRSLASGPRPGSLLRLIITATPSTSSMLFPTRSQHWGGWFFLLAGSTRQGHCPPSWDGCGDRHLGTWGRRQVTSTLSLDILSRSHHRYQVKFNSILHTNYKVSYGPSWRHTCWFAFQNILSMCNFFLADKGFVPLPTT